MADKPVLPHTPTHTCGKSSYCFILASTHRDQCMLWLKLTALFTGCSSTDVCISDIDEALKRDRVEVLYTSPSIENEIIFLLLYKCPEHLTYQWTMLHFQMA